MSEYFHYYGNRVVETARKRERDDRVVGIGIVGKFAGKRKVGNELEVEIERVRKEK